MALSFHSLLGELVDALLNDALVRERMQQHSMLERVQLLVRP